MIEERILSAVERIDDAMSRIEAAARRPAPLPRDIADAGVLADLRERHATMRGRVQAAIAELDMLMNDGTINGRPHG